MNQKDFDILLRVGEEGMSNVSVVQKVLQIMN